MAIVPVRQLLHEQAEKGKLWFELSMFQYEDPFPPLNAYQCYFLDGDPLVYVTKNGRAMVMKDVLQKSAIVSRLETISYITNFLLDIIKAKETHKWEDKLHHYKQI